MNDPLRKRISNPREEAHGDLPAQGEFLQFSPWAEYASGGWRDRRQLAVAMVSALALMIGVAVTAWPRAGDPGAIAPPTTVPVSTPVQSLPEAGPTLYAEADLRAAPVADPMWVTAAAEDFVFAYFTSDPSASAGPAADLAAALGGEPEIRTYVEWLRAVEVVELPEGSFEVHIRVRMLEMSDAVRRIPPFTAVVVLEAGDRGLTVKGPPRLGSTADIGLFASDQVERVTPGPGGIPMAGASADQSK